jgi:hypothetical protein
MPEGLRRRWNESDKVELRRGTKPSSSTAQAGGRCSTIPAEIPDGVSVRVLLLWEPVAEDDDTLKRLIAGVTEGLTEDDLTPSRDLGRGAQK